MGMYNMCMYERFSITDIGKFERRLAIWCNEACMHGKSMLIFDKDSLRIGVESTVEKHGEEEYFKVVLPQISFTFTRIAGKSTNMCVMHKVWENKTKSVMYNMPRNWDGTELWLGV